MDFIESLRLALRALQANKLRSALTMLGIIIGVSAVISLMSIGNGATAQITNQIQSMGSNLLFISPGATQQAGVRQAQGTQPTLTLEDANALANPDDLPMITAVAPEVNGFGQVVAGASNVNTRILGVTPAYQDVRKYEVAEGEFISEQNVQARSLVVILGSNVAQTLFPGGDPVGQTLKINRLPFRVVGVLVSKGSQAMGNQDDIVMAPITTVQQRINRQRTVAGSAVVQTINVQVADGVDMQQATASIAELLRARHRVAQDDFTIGSQEDLLATVRQITGVLTLLLGAIAGISLVVGGIGIMNIMLVSVTERTREIGIRKAVGAKYSHILAQFLVEAVVVSLVGGAAGVLLGTGLATLISSIDFGGQKLPSVITADSILLATGVSASIGLFFGIYPANRAARLSPIEALRYE
jgi:putative ABC transport system permease protein